MDRITLTRTATSEAAPSSLRITIRVKPRPLRVALLSLGIVLWGCGAASIVCFPGADASRLRSPLAALLDLSVLAYAAIGILLMGHLSWILFGRETYEISPRALCVRRSIGPFGLRRTYRFADMQDARIIPGRAAAVPPWKLMCLETERETIVLRHRERYVRLARDLDKAEGAYLLTAIRLWMQDR